MVKRQMVTRLLSFQIHVERNYLIIWIQSARILIYSFKLDGVGPVDKRPSTD